MSVLCDWELKRAGSDLLDPFDVEMVQPASIDIRLGTTFRVFKMPREGDVNTFLHMVDKPSPDSYSEEVTLELGEELMIHPGELMLGSTLERITVPSDLVMTLEGKSSLARMGLLPHVQAGYFDPGWDGVGTLELVNLSPWPIALVVGAKVCQSRWTRMSGVPTHLYGSSQAGSHYQGARGVEGAKT